MTSYKPTDLYGGAIKADIPSDFGDVSHIRQVPDTQEVFLSSTGYTSIVFDLLERVDEGKSDQEALVYHFEDIVEDDTVNTKVWKTEEVTFAKLPTHKSLTLFATHTLPTTANAKAQTSDFTVLLVTLLRLAEQKTDVVVCVNIPHTSGEYDPRDVDLEQGRLGRLVEEGLKVRERVLETFEVVEWGLFGVEE